MVNNILITTKAAHKTFSFLDQIPSDKRTVEQDLLWLENAVLISRELVPELVKEIETLRQKLEDLSFGDYSAEEDE